MTEKLEYSKPTECIVQSSHLSSRFRSHHYVIRIRHEERIRSFEAFRLAACCTEYWRTKARKSVVRWIEEDSIQDWGIEIRRIRTNRNEEILSSRSYRGFAQDTFSNSWYSIRLGRIDFLPEAFALHVESWGWQLPARQDMCITVSRLGEPTLVPSKAILIAWTDFACVWALINAGVRRRSQGCTAETRIFFSPCCQTI